MFIMTTEISEISPEVWKGDEMYQYINTYKKFTYLLCCLAYMK
jgi:hypothetical protein